MPSVTKALKGHGDLTSNSKVRENFITIYLCYLKKKIHIDEELRYNTFVIKSNSKFLEKPIFTTCKITNSLLKYLQYLLYNKSFKIYIYL